MLASIRLAHTGILRKTIRRHQPVRLCTLLPDAPVPNDPDASEWIHFADIAGHDDYVSPADRDETMLLYLRSGIPFSVQRIPAADPAPWDEPHGAAALTPAERNPSLGHRP